MKKLLLALLISLPLTVFGQDISGTGWKLDYDDGDRQIFLFESDGTFTYLNIVSFTGNTGKVFSDDSDTWSLDGNKVIISFTSGYMLASLTLNINGDSMSGTTINKKGLVRGVTAKLIK